MANHVAEPTEQEIRAGVDYFIRRMLAWTIKLVRIEHDQPRSVCSGFIYERNNRHTLFTVLHSFQSNKADLDDVQFDGWHVETDVVADGQSVLITLPPIQFIKEATVTEAGIVDPKHVDLVWGHLDVAKLREKLRVEPRLKGKDITLPIYRGSINRLPDAVHSYGFASLSQVELVRSGISYRRFYRHPVYEIMTFDGYDDRGLCRFKLAEKHKGDDVYHGSSGSPIADDEGAIVALVKGGCEVENVIYGVPLARYGVVLDVPDTH
jgi:hypothetical protein